MNKKLNVVVITAHPDDLEIGCGGTVSRLLSEGHQVTGLITVKPSSEIHPSRNEIIVREELRAAREVLGYDLIVLDTDTFPNGRPNLQCNNQTITEIEKKLIPVVEYSDLDIIITHHAEDWHQDHRITWELAQSVSRLSKQLWCMEIYPYCNQYRNFKPNKFIDITQHIDRKLNAVQTYSSYITLGDIRNIKSLAEVRGGFMDHSYAAEVFEVKFDKSDEY